MFSFSFASTQVRKTLLVTTRQPPVHWDSTEHPPPNYRSTMSTMSLGRFSFVQTLPARRSLCSGLKALISMERGKQSGKAGRTRHDSFLRTIDASTSFPYHPTSPFRSCIRILSSRCPTLSSSSTPTHLIWVLSKEAEYKEAFTGESWYPSKSRRALKRLSVFTCKQ